MKMNIIGKLSWLTEDEQVDVHSPDDALAAIRDVDEESRSRPIALEVTRPDGEVMMIILGDDRSCLAWWPKDYKGMGSKHTVAEGFDPERDRIPSNPEVITYYFFGHHNEVPMQYTIPKEKAFQAVREFLLSPGPASCVRWEMD